MKNVHRSPPYSLRNWPDNPLFGAVALIVTVLVLYMGALDNPIFADSIPILSPDKLAAPAGLWNVLDRRGVATITFAWIYGFLGPDWFWQNLCNVILHAAVASGIFLLSRKMTLSLLDKRGELDAVSARRTTRFAFLFAFLFAASPTAPYAVAYLVQRYVLLATLFSLASVAAFLNALESGATKHYAATAVYYGLALHSKEHAVMLPALLGALYVLSENPVNRDEFLSYFRKTAVFWTACLVLAAHAVIQAKSSVGSVYEPNAAAILATHDADGWKGGNLLLLSALSQSWLFFRYLFSWITPLPSRLSIEVLMPLPSGYFAFPECLAPLLYLAFGAMGALWLRRGGIKGLCGWALLWPWFLFWTELVAVHVSEHFVLYRGYLWAAGFFCGGPALLRLVLGTRGTARALTAALALLACAFFLRTRLVTLKTFDSVSAVWADAVAKLSEEMRFSFRAHRPYYFLAQSFFHENRLEESKPFYLETLQRNPKIIQAGQNLGYIAFAQHNLESAEKYYRAALDIAPDDTEILMNLGNVLTAKGQSGEALEYYARSLAADPSNRLVRYNIARTRARRGEWDEAERELRESVALGYADFETLDFLGKILVQKKNYAEALPYLHRALALKPENAELRELIEKVQSQ